ncbi:Epimerase family protein SA0724 [Dermatophilus congolensis]|uniref:Epimerase family protein SA0724 n=1 Tax=Dermatophilus congolensis TaxID=1863 RepID=A0AA46H179_9MICO|nr:Epimerase family protein SA0724 [Dermatophilus congolensis]
MGLVTSQVVDFPLSQVFSWHMRPGAFLRLSPPFAPIQPHQEAHSLADGTALLRFGSPWGPIWVAQHQPQDYRPPHRFVDVGTIPALGSLGERFFYWRHQHDFTEVGEGTRITDSVLSNVPGAMLRSMFAFRHAVLEKDLTAHRTMRQLHPEPMTVAITGASGLVGRQLSALLTTGGHRVIHLVRRKADQSACVTDNDGNLIRSERFWDTNNPTPDLLEGVDAVVHLAGASIAGRFTDEHKKTIWSSRIGPTAALAHLAGTRPFICASAVGIYGNDRPEPVDETSCRGQGFLADVVQAWEADAHTAAGRVVNIRTGIVQSSHGGVLGLQRPLYQAGLGGPLGGGQQWLPWIALDDLIDIYYRALVDDRLHGPVNAVAPNPVKQKDWASSIGKVLHRPAFLPTPSQAPTLLLGSQGTRELALASQHVLPGVLARIGHEFRYPQLTAALKHELGREKLLT